MDTMAPITCGVPNELLVNKIKIQDNVRRGVQIPVYTESCFRHPLFDLRGTRKVEIKYTNFHFSSKKVTSKSRNVKVFDLTIVKKLSTFRPKKAKVEKLKSRKVEKLKSRKVEKLKS